MEVTIKIVAPELAHALETLAIAIGCTVDKIGVGEAIEEAVTQKPTVAIEENQPEVQKEQTEAPKEITEEAKPITIEQMREVFVAKNSKANTAKLKAVLKKHGVVKVTDLPEESFADVIKELEEI